MAGPVLAPGRLLVATPLIGDPNFSRTVVLLLAHREGQGTFGVVLNRPSTTEVDEVIPEWSGLVADPTQLFVGGPVEREAVVGIGRVAGEGGAGPDLGFTQVLDGVGTIDLSRVPDSDDALPLAAVRLFAGSAGWAAGQLEGEIDEGAWWVVDGRPGDVLTDDPDQLWSAVLRRQRGELRMWAGYPENPSLN